MAITSHPARTPTVYEPPTGSVQSPRAVVADVRDRWPLIWHLARTEMKAQHYNTALGKLWLILDPILLAATFYLVRAVIAGGGSGEQRSFIIAHLIMGVSFFYYVRAVFMGIARCPLVNRGLILNTATPRVVFPAVALVTALLELVPTLIVYFGVHFALGQPWGVSLVMLPVVIALLTMFSVGAGLLYAPAVVFFRDSQTVLPYILRIWMYTTPVMFAVDEIPESFKVVFMINPLYPYFAALESIFAAEMPSVGLMLGCVAWAVVALTAGVLVYSSKEREFAVRL